TAISCRWAATCAWSYPGCPAHSGWPRSVRRCKGRRADAPGRFNRASLPVLPARGLQKADRRLGGAGGKRAGAEPVWRCAVRVRQSATQPDEDSLLAPKRLLPMAKAAGESTFCVAVAWLAHHGDALTQRAGVAAGGLRSMGQLSAQNSEISISYVIF